MTKNRIRNPMTSRRINELKRFMSKNKKAEVYEPSEELKKIDGYLGDPVRVREWFKHAAIVANIPVYVHQFKGVIVFIRTDI